MKFELNHLPTWHAQRLVTLLEALGDPLVSQLELDLLEWIAGQELATVQNLTAVIRRCRNGSEE